MALALALAHVFVGIYIFPVPLVFILFAALLVVALSFLLVTVRPLPLRAADSRGAPVPRVVVWLMATLAVVYLAFLAVIGIFGRQELAAVNAASLVFWVYTFPLLPIAHLFVGGMYDVANPFARIAQMLSGGRRLRSADRVLTRLGYWPAVVWMILLVLAESITEFAQRPILLGIGVLLYAAVQIVMGTLLGEGWYQGGDVFHAITALASTLSPWGFGRDRDARVRFRIGFNPARYLPQACGREALITLWLAGVLADGVRATPIWRVLILPHIQGFFDRIGTTGGVNVGAATEVTLEILATWAAFGAFFWVFVAVASTVSRDRPRPLLFDRERLGRMAAAVSPSLIPISLAYLFAHNLSQILAVGPLIVTGRDAPASQVGLLVTLQASRIDPGTLWWLQVSAIVLGHMLAVLMANARLRQFFGGRDRLAVWRATKADLGWLSAMLLYTATSLWILAQPVSSA